MGINDITASFYWGETTLISKLGILVYEEAVYRADPWLGHATGDEIGTGRATRYFEAVHWPVGRSAPARRILRTV